MSVFAKRRQQATGQVAGLQVRDCEHVGTRVQRVAAALVRAVGAALLATGVLWACADILGLAPSIAALAAACFAGSLVASLCTLHPATRFVPAALVALAIVVAALVAGPALVEGARALWTVFASRLADATSARLSELALADTAARDANAANFLVFCAPGLAMLFAGLAGLQQRWWLVLLVVPVFLVAVVEQLSIGPAALVCCVLGCAALLGMLAAREPGLLAQGSFGPSRALTAGCIALAALAGLGAAFLICAPPSWHQPDALAALRDAGAAGVHQLRYGGQPNALADGRLSSLEAWHADDATALTVQADKVEPQYLRGFVGAERDAQGWKTLGEAEYHASDALFWWLHDSGFFAQSQLVNARSAALEDADAAAQAKRKKLESGDAPQTYSVLNRHASSEYLYTPYGLAGSELQASCKDRADEGFSARGLFGQREYSFEAVASAETQYPDTAALSWIARDEQKAYWRDESNYNEFVYKHYAKNSDADEALVTRVLGKAPVTEGSHVEYVSAAKEVVSWLADNVAYDESMAAPSDEKDLLSEFLSGTKRGWSVHYATAAVAMLRHLHIPARYVEGYLVKPSDIASQGTTSVDVPAANGHAWAEMYVDGCGWVPVETVPAVRAEMPQPDWARGIEADGSRHAGVPPAPEEIEQPDTSMSIGEILVSVLAGILIALLVLLIAFDIFALVFFIVSLVRRLLARRRRRMAFGSADNTAAAKAMASWMAALARFRFPQIPAGDARQLQTAVAGAYGSELADEWAAAQALGRKAAFSPHGVTAEERDTLQGASAHFAQEVAAAQTVHDRWIMKYVERLL